MNHHLLPLLLCAVTSAPIFAQDKPAADPPQLIAVREEHLRAMQRASVPVLQSYVTKLNSLKSQLGREGKLESGLAVENELREVTRQLQTAQSITDLTKPISQQLTIVSAVYGDLEKKRTVNVERILREAYGSGKATLKLNNENLNKDRDPAPYRKKETAITYIVGGEKKVKTFGENAVVDFKNDLR